MVSFVKNLDMSGKTWKGNIGIYLKKKIPSFSMAREVEKLPFRNLRE